MLGINLKCSAAAVAVMADVLATAGPAGTQPPTQIADRRMHLDEAIL